MILLNPKKYDIKHSDKRFQEIIDKTIDFFENKSLKKVKDDDHQNIWYSDFLEFVKNEEIFATLLTLGEIFTLVVYGQLILENAKIYNIDDDTVDQIFDCLIRDFSKFAVQLYSKSSATSLQRRICSRMIKRPAVNKDRFKNIWENYVYTLKDQYVMNE